MNRYNDSQLKIFKKTKKVYIKGILDIHNEGNF